MLAATARCMGISHNRNDLFRWTMEAEKLQHGRPSGADPYTCLHGGLLLFQNKQAQTLTPLQEPLLLVNSGTPTSTTGECVEHVTRNIGRDGPWDKFENTTREIQKSLSEYNPDALRRAIRENHRLLQEIGVVPPRIAKFIKHIEDAGGAAKICGAGSVSGDRAGIIWLVAKDALARQCCREFGFSLFLVETDTNGTRLKNS